jgi:hypothetical protein
MFVIAYFLVSATIVLGLYSATARPTPKLSAQTPRHVRAQRADAIRSATQPNLTHVNCLS